MEMAIISDPQSKSKELKMFCPEKSQGKLFETAVAEPISTSTPQMNYTVKRVNENSQNTMKGQKGEITIITRDNLFVVFTSVYVNVRGGCM